EDERPQARRLRDPVLLTEEPAPRRPEHVIPLADAEVVDEVRKLPDEELHRPEVAAAFGEMRRPAVPELVIEDDGASVAGQAGERQQVVVGRAGAAVQEDERRRPVSAARTNL